MPSTNKRVGGDSFEHPGDFEKQGTANKKMPGDDRMHAVDRA